jgi:DNA-binding protein YbaB
MSRLALELERAVKEMRAKSAKERAGAKASKTQAKRPFKEVKVEESGNSNGNQLTSDMESVKTDDANLSQQEVAAGSNDAAGDNENAEGKKKPTMAKKTSNGAAKKAKAPKAAAKAPKAPSKGQRKPREKKLASGKLKKIEASGTTYLTLEFEEGTITLTPTGNREQNRDVAVKALRGLL